MSKGLEDFIRTNREEFDDLEPTADLWERIEKNLPAQFNEPKKRVAKTFSLGFVLRVAASVIVVMGISFALYLRGTKKQGVDLVAINPVYAQQQVHYASQIETKRIALKSIAKTNPELYEQFKSQIAEMDSTYKQLSSELPNSPNQELVLKAMIRNLQIQTQVLTQQLNVIGQFNEMKKEQNNDSKNI
jgi:anti-sigma-K factor RskA